MAPAYRRSLETDSAVSHKRGNNMSNILLLNKPQVLVGLATMTYIVPTTGQYFVSVQFTENPTTGLSVVVNDNGSPIFTAPTVLDGQIAQQFKYAFAATATHVITVVFASSTAIDKLLNTVKSTTTIGQGNG